MSEPASRGAEGRPHTGRMVTAVTLVAACAVILILPSPASFAASGLVAGWYAERLGRRALGAWRPSVSRVRGKGGPEAGLREDPAVRLRGPTGSPHEDDTQAAGARSGLRPDRDARLRIEEVLADPGLVRPSYQPILSLIDGRVAGYEALARFATEPARPPSVWFAEAIAVGLGGQLQALAIRRALEEARAAGLPGDLFLSVNVSPQFLDHPAVVAAMGDGSLEQVVVEITETEAVEDYARLREAMRTYRARGARFAVDDTGAGYASMRHVMELWPAFVKLDANLIGGLRDDRGRQALLRALYGFAAEIGATLIAEGVEGLEDLALLARTRFPILVQGYAIARPAEPWPAVGPAVHRVWRDARELGGEAVSVVPAAAPRREVRARSS